MDINKKNSNQEREQRQKEKEDQIKEDFKLTEKWAQIGFWGNLVLAAIKFWAGIVANSSAMVADAVHSASDIFASLFVFISLKIAQKPADKKHPYGHHKAEVISTIIVGLMLGMAGYHIISSAIGVIRVGEFTVPGRLALYAAVFSILTKELMYRFTYKAGITANSPATIANAKDHRSDAFSSVATFIGILGAILGLPILDPIAGIIVAGFILKMAFDIIMDAVSQIMDENLDQEKIDEVNNIATGVDGVLGTHGIRIRRSGSVILVDMDIEVNRGYTMQMAHDVCEEVRERIFDKLNKVNEVRVHIDPR